MAHSARYPKNIREIAAALADRYGDFDHYNLKDPLDELLFIICSTKTSESSYRHTFEQLKHCLLYTSFVIGLYGDQQTAKIPPFEAIDLQLAELWAEV